MTCSFCFTFLIPHIPRLCLTSLLPHTPLIVHTLFTLFKPQPITPHTPSWIMPHIPLTVNTPFMPHTLLSGPSTHGLHHLVVHTPILLALHIPLIDLPPEQIVAHVDTWTLCYEFRKVHVHINKGVGAINSKLATLEKKNSIPTIRKTINTFR